MSYPPRRRGFLSFPKVSMAWRLAKREIVSSAGFALAGSLATFAAVGFTLSHTNPTMAFVQAINATLLFASASFQAARALDVVRKARAAETQRNRQSRGPRGPAP